MWGCLYTQHFFAPELYLDETVEEVAIIAHDGFELDDPWLGPQNNPGPLTSSFHRSHIPIGPSNQLSLCVVK